MEKAKGKSDSEEQNGGGVKDVPAVRYVMADPHPDRSRADFP